METGNDYAFSTVTIHIKKYIVVRDCTMYNNDCIFMDQYMLTTLLNENIGNGA